MLTSLTSSPVLRQLLMLGAVSLSLGHRERLAEHLRDGVPDAHRTGDGVALAPPVTFSSAEVQALVRGFAAEVDAVQAARARGRAAKTPAERGQAAQAEWEDATVVLGAKAAGMPLARYRAVRAAVNETLQTLDFQGKIPGPLEMDLSAASPETRARLARDPLAALPPASAAALKANFDAIVAVWIRYTTLVAVNG
jgi:hypothetical protein